MPQGPRLPSLGPAGHGVEMAAHPDVPAVPGVVVGSVLLLVLSSNPVWGNYTVVEGDTRSNITGQNIAAIVAPTVILSVLAIVLAVLAWLLCVVKRRDRPKGRTDPVLRSSPVQAAWPHQMR